MCIRDRTNITRTGAHQQGPKQPACTGAAGAACLFVPPLSKTLREYRRFSCGTTNATCAAQTADATEQRAPWDNGGYRQPRQRQQAWRSLLPLLRIFVTPVYRMVLVKWCCCLLSLRVARRISSASLQIAVGHAWFIVCVCLWWFPAQVPSCLCIPYHRVCS